MNKFVSIICLAALAACSHKQVQQTEVKPNPFRLYVMECGEVTVKDISMFSPGHDKGKTKVLTDSCYIITHPKGIMFWDSGLSDGLIDKPEGAAAFDGKMILKVKKTLASQLKEIGIDPKTVTVGAISHLHGDHTGNAMYYSNAKIYMQTPEYEVAFGEHPEKAGFNPETYKSLKGNIEKISGDKDVFGDGTVVIKSTPGHTPGHQSLFVNLPKTGPIVLSGDLYHFTKNRTKKRVPSFNFDKDQTLKSMEALEAFTKEKKAQFWIQHDLEQNKTVMHSPKFYE